MSTQQANGLHLLKGAGVPDGAVTAMLIALAGLTALPFVAGREFGPYSIPDVVQGGTFWFLALSTPLAWVVLLGNVFGNDWTYRKRAVKTLLILEVAAALLAFASSPTEATIPFNAELGPGEPSRPFIVDLPAVSRAKQRVNVFVEELEGVNEALPDGFGIHVEICGASAGENCKRQQRGRNDTIVEFFDRGSVRIGLFNYAANVDGGAQPRVRVSLRVSYLKRRWI
jgi:hypothetical protein